MDNSNPNQPGSHYDPQTGQPISNEPPTEPYSQPPDAFRAPSPGPGSGIEQPVVPPAQPGYAAPGAPYTPGPQVNVNERRSNTPLIAGILGIVLVAALGIGGYYLYNKLLNRPTVAVERVLPTNTLGYFTLDPSPGGTQKEALDKMREAFESQPGFKEAWARISQQAADMGQLAGLGTPGPTSTASDFDALSSYLGNNVTVAVLPPSTDDLQKLKDSANGGNTESTAMGVLGRNVVGIVDLDFSPLNKKGPISELKQQADNLGKTEVAEKYRDVDIHRYITGTNTIYFSLLNDTSTAVVGAQLAPLHSVIDQYKDNKGLKDDDTFKALSGQVPQERVASLYVNLTEIYKEAQLAAPEAFSNGAVQKADGAMLITLSAHDDGMQIDAASQVDVQGAGVQVNPNARPEVATLSDIPTGTLGFLASTDLKTAIQSALDAMRKQSQSSGQDAVQQQLDQFEQSSGVNLEKDVLPLLGGDYVLSGSADDTNGEPSPSVVFQLKLNPADRAKALQVLDKLLQTVGNGQAEKFDAAGGTFYTISPEVGAVVGVGGDRLMFVYDKDAEAAKAKLNAVTSNLGKGFGSTTEWRNIAQHLPRDSNALGYLDISGIRAVAERSMSPDSKQEYETSAAPFLRPFKYLLFGSATQAAREGNLSRNHTVIFLGVSK